MYKVIKFFTDLQDGNHAYNVGDIFPRKGVAVSEERIARLASTNNARKCVLIEKVEEPKVEEKEEPKKTLIKKGKKK